jgi:hypothetical protein
MGDFNFPELKWGINNDITDEHPFVSCLHDNFLEQLVDKPTRGENFLDLLISSDICFIQNVVVGEPFLTSDHQIIRFELFVSKDSEKEAISSFNYFKANYNMVHTLHSIAKSKN